ncbi:MAG: FAD-dependent oxidoreductase [Deltaproteobacteria bacterium]|nr:FAD-dependent oxidoreductase [Deltaproteobacteria bacterium]
MPKNVVIIGAVALGPKAACRFKRLEPDAQVTMIDADNIISYGGCGIPYFVSGDVSDAKELMSTSFHMVRDAGFFHGAKGVDVMTRTRAVLLDRPGKRVICRNLDTGAQFDLGYDKLVLATGSRPNRLNIPGADLDNVFVVANMSHAEAIKSQLTSGAVAKAVIIGAGFIGLEMAEALTDLWGIEVTIIEFMDHVLPGLIDPNLAGMVQKKLQDEGVTCLLGERVQAIEGQGKATGVVTDKRKIEADLVIMAVGARPNVDLAREAGLAITPGGAIEVNSHLQTSDPDIFAGGDCVENRHLITGKQVYLPLGSLANRHGRVIGSNLAGLSATFDGVVGNLIIKVFDHAVAGAGLTLSRARAAGFDAVSAFVVQGDRAHFYPEMEFIYLELVVDRATARVLGIQGLSSNGQGLAARVDAVAAVLKYQPTITDISNLEVAYSPPFASAMDIVNALANTAENILAGRNRAIEVDEFDLLFSSGQSGEAVVLDVRAWGNAEPFVKKYPDRWVNIPQEQLSARVNEVPRDKRLVLVCNSGARSYEAQITLNQAGLTNTCNLQGGVAAVKKWGRDLLGEEPEGDGSGH